MPRTVDRENRSQLLDRAVDYVYENGIATLSLRPLAKALGVSPGVLIYHFASKERLIVEMLARAGHRQRVLFERMRSDDDRSSAEVCRDAWRVLSDPKAQQIFRLFFEVYALALQDATRFPGFFPGAVANWLAFLEQPALRDGASKREARKRATIILAGFRGFLLDLCATRERTRVDGAVEAWIQSLDAIPIGTKPTTAST
jgi:AcrR family transcriptional regulator